MSNLKFKTRGMVNPKRKPRVYFTCHPEDFDLTFRKVCEDILKQSDCAIYYPENMAEALSEGEQESILKMMNLFVIPVTRNLLSEPNKAMDSDFAFARENKIPVLPVLFEPGLEGIYSQEDKFGELQYINPFSTDITEIRYEEKLKKFLDSVLISDDTLGRIKNAFDAYIFLSYRKMDRNYANELMRIIHSYDEFRDIAIWYDEYLVLGESFHKNIIEMMNESKIFSLLVTPNILLDTNNGTPNFVVGEEYPKAKEFGLEIIAAEMKNTDKAELSAKFSQLPECTNPYNQDDFKSALLESLKNAGVTTHRNDSGHKYLIGLAYRDGVDVEVDRVKGMNLIRQAAEDGSIEAIDELVTMYYFGIYAERDYPQAAYWQKKKISLICKENKSAPTTKSALDLIDSLRFYTEIVRNSIDKQDKIYQLIEYCKEALNLCNDACPANDYEKSRLIESKLNTLRSLAILYEDAGDFDSACDSYNEALYLRCLVAEADELSTDENVKIINKYRLAQIHHDIGILFEKKGDFISAVEKFEDSLEIYEDLSLETSDFLTNMIRIHIAIAQAAVYTDISKALGHSKSSLELCQTLYDADPKHYDIFYANTLLARAFVLGESGDTDLDNITNITKKAADIFSVYKDDGSHDSAFNMMNVLYKLAGTYIRSCSWANAEEHFMKAIDIAKILLPIEDVDTQESIAHILFDYGTFTLTRYGTQKLDVSEKAVNKALEIFCRVSEIKPHCRKYIKDAETVLEIINKARSSIGTVGEVQAHEIPATEKNIALVEFQRFYTRGDTLEHEKNYEKAALNYRSALEQLEKLDTSALPSKMVILADVYDRIALCYEMIKNYSDAKEYYTRAMTVSITEAEKAKSPELYTSAINLTWKLASFCEDFGYAEDAAKYYDLRACLMDEKSKLTSYSDDEDFLNPYSEDENSSAIILTDESGEKIAFRAEDIIKYQGKEYVILVACGGIKKGVVMVTFDDDDNCRQIEDNALFSVLFEIFKERNRDRFDFTD